MTRWLRSHGAASADVSVYINDLRSLFHLPSQEQYKSMLETMEKKWSAPFYEYFANNINPDIRAIARWAIEPFGIYNPFSGITNNQAESLNYVVKQLQEWRESPLDCVVLSLYHLQSYYMMEICRGQNGLGNYKLFLKYCNLAPQPIPDVNVYSPEMIVQRVKGRCSEFPEHHTAVAGESDTKQLSQRERAQRLLQEKKISFDSNLHVFTVLGSGDKPHAVKLFPAASCTCPSTSQCYHIIAARMFLGMEDAITPPTKINLTQLRRNTRKRKEKKSGRKFPRVGDCEVIAAPDASSGTKQGTNYYLHAS